MAAFLLPADIVNYCCSCKRMYRCSVHVLPRHLQMTQALCCIDDEDTVRLKSLLRALSFEETANPVFVDSTDRSTIVKPSDSFYVRHLYIRQVRETFADWSRQSADILPVEDGELQSYIDACRDILQLPDSDANRWIKDFQLGADNVLKTILMAFLPELEILTFVQNVMNIVRVRPGTRGFQTLSSLTFVPRRLSSLPPLEWPCFQSLHSVTIGINSQCYNQYFHYTVKDIAPLLLLPKLVNLRLSRVVGDAEAYSWEWEPRISSCENLSIQPTEQVDIDSISGLLKGNQEHQAVCARWDGMESEAQIC